MEEKRRWESAAAFFYLSMWWLPTVSKGWTGYLKMGYTCSSASAMAREFLKMNLYFERHI